MDKKCRDCVCSLFAPLYVCLSHVEKPLGNGSFRLIEKDSLCHNGGYMPKSHVKKRGDALELIKNAKASLKRKE